MDYDTPPKFDEWDDVPLCVIGKCMRPVRSFDLCSMHYARYRSVMHLMALAEFIERNGPTFREYKQSQGMNEAHCSTCTCHPVVSDEEDPETILSRVASD